MEFLSYLLKSSLCLGVFVGLYAALLRRETFYAAARGYFGLALVVSLGLPLVEVPVWSSKAVPGTEFAANRYVPDLSFRFDRQPETATVRPSAEENTPAAWPVETVLLLGYALGVGVLTLRLEYQLVSLAQVRLRARGVEVSGQRVWVPAGPTQPFSFFGWVFLDPSRYSETELDEILRHEAVHVRQGHSVDVLVAELLTIAFWFNPAAWLFRALLKQNLEFLVDQRVLQSGLDARRYQFSLLKWSGFPVPTTVANAFAIPQLKNRIRQINTPTSARWRVLKFGLALPVVGVLGMGFNGPDYKFLNKINTRGITNDFVSSGTFAKSSKGDVPKEGIAVPDSQPKRPTSVRNNSTNSIESGDTNSLIIRINAMESIGLVREGPKSQIKRIFDGTKDYEKEPLFFVDGSEVYGGQFELHLKPNNIESIEVFQPGNPALVAYGEQGKYGLIEIKTKRNATNLADARIAALPDFKSKSYFLLDSLQRREHEAKLANYVEPVFASKNGQMRILLEENQKPLYRIDDKWASYEEVKQLRSENVWSDFLWPQTAVKLYGWEARDGVINFHTLKKK